MEKTILAIETSCDETSIALVHGEKDQTGKIKIEKIAHIIHSQAELHSKYGGVFPNLAKREHATNLVPILLEIIQEAKRKKIDIFKEKSVITEENKPAIEALLSREPELYEYIVRHLVDIKGNVDAIAVTQGPGLEPALWVGINFAKALSLLWEVPLVPINHMEGHMISALFDETTQSFISPDFPILSLLISGGHTEIIRMESPFSYTLLGKTRDDAVGEAYDKVARLLGIPYPGGPTISRMAHKARVEDIQSFVELPRPMRHTHDLDFSFSGLKTAVLYAIRDKDLTEEAQLGLVREFEEAVSDVLASKISKALLDNPSKVVLVGGGVSANTYIQEKITDAIHTIDPHTDIRVPTRELTTDNAYMIALALIYRIFHGEDMPTYAPSGIEAKGNLSLG